jgi:hypothetical protein
MSKYFNFFDDYDFYDDHKDLDKNVSHKTPSYYSDYGYGSYYGNYNTKFYNFNVNAVPSIINPDISYWDSKDIVGEYIDASKDAIKFLNNAVIKDDNKYNSYREFMSLNLQDQDNFENHVSFSVFEDTSHEDSDHYSFQEYLEEKGIQNNLNQDTCYDLQDKKHIDYINAFYDYLHSSRENSSALGFIESKLNNYKDDDDMFNKIEDLKSNIALNTLNSTGSITEDELKMIKIDLYKNFYNKEMQFSVDNDKAWWFKILSNVDNYMMKMITGGSKINSTIMSNNLFDSTVKSLYEYFKMKYDQSGEIPDIKNEISNNFGNENNEGDNNQQDNGIPQELKSMMEKNNAEAFNKSLNEINEMNNIMSSLGIDPSKVGDQDMNDIKSIAQELEGVKINRSDIEKFVKSSIKSFNSAFRGHRHINEEDFFEAEEIEEFTDYHLLSNEVLFDEMSVVNSRYSMKYDIYVDCSGSMDSEVSYGDSEMRRISLAKILTYKMNKMNLLGDIYGFEGHVYPIKDIMNQLSANGGTRIDSCVDNIKKTGRPSIILSDGDDTIKTDDNNAFLFTICSSCRGEGLYSMAKSGRAIHYDNGQFYNYEAFDSDKHLTAHVNYNNSF